MLFFLLFFPSGIFSEFIPFLLGTSSGIIIAYSYKVSAFLLFISIPNLLHVKENEILLHRLYSDSLKSFFVKILLRRNLKIYILGSFIVFAYIFNAYEIPYILGSNIEKMPSVFVYEQLSEFGMESVQKAYLMSFIYFIFTLLFVPVFLLIYQILTRTIS
jgi:putative spermidine/putrescine transport system permease protein